MLGLSLIHIQMCIRDRYKYVSRGGKVDGFYSGNTFANQLGISAQVPNKVEIVSNNMAAKIREIPIGKRTFIVRRPVVPVNEENVYVLQLLDLSLIHIYQCHSVGGLR